MVIFGKDSAEKRYRRCMQMTLLLSLIGIMVSFFLVLKYFQPALASTCNLNSYFNCTAVNESKYARLLGVPVAFFGLGSYILMFIVAAMLYREFDFRKISKKLTPYRVFLGLFWFVSFGLLFSLWLTFAELFLIKAVCLFCIMHQVTILLLFFSLLTLWMDMCSSKKNEVYKKYFGM